MAFMSALTIALALQDDAIPLKNGRVVVGTIIERRSDALVIERIGGMGVVEIPFSLIPERDLPRFTGGGATKVEAEEKGIAGLRIATSYRIIEGILVREDPATKTLWIKTRGSKEPIPVARSSILAIEPAKLTEADIYTPSELLDERIKKTPNPDDPGNAESLGDFAGSVGLFDRARAFYETAKAALEKSASELPVDMDPDERDRKVQELEGRIQGLDLKIKEIIGRDLLKEVQELSDKAEFDKAIARAEELLRVCEGTAMARENADLPDRIRAAQEEFRANREKYLRKKTLEAFPKLLENRFRDAARLPSIAEAMKVAQATDDQILKEIADKFQCTEEEFRKWFSEAEGERAKKKRRAKLGTGSWIVLGGQDGGFDRPERGNQPPRQAPRPGQPGEPEIGDRGGLPGGPGRIGIGPLGRNQGQWTGVIRPKPIPIQTKQQWWESVPSYTRQEFLEAFWVRESSFFEGNKTRHEHAKKCPYCNGRGTRPVQDYDKFIDAVCPRCHTSKYELEYLYW